MDSPRFLAIEASKRSPRASVAMTLSALVVIVAAMVAASESPAIAQPVVIQDGEFAESDWQVTETLVSGSSQTAERRGDGGNPGAYRHMVHDLPGPSSLSVHHLYLGATYDPSTQGAIAGITYSEDRIEFDPPFTGAAVGALFFIAQENRIHFSSNLTYTSTSWTNAKLSCLEPESFTMSGGRLPDFSAEGAPMRFGFLRSNSNDSLTGRFPVVHGIDNFRVVVFPEPNPDCAGEPADVKVEKSDQGHQWGSQQVIPYSIVVSNAGAAASGAVTLVETVPERTTFTADGSTPGWQCEPDPNAGSTCEFEVANLAGGEQSTIAFHVRVADGTDPLWDVYNELQAGVTPPLSPVRSAEKAFTGNFGIGLGLGLAITPFGTCPGADPVLCCAWCTFFVNDCESIGLASHLSIAETAAANATATSSDPVLLYRLRDRVLADTRGGRRAVDLYYEHSSDIVTAALQDGGIITAGVTNLLDWQANVQALVSGAGASAFVTQQQIDGLQAFLDALRAEADAGLVQAIDRERARLDLDDWVGIDMEEALRRLDRLSCEGYELELFCGELTGDCNITASDALAALQIAVGTRSGDSAADMDGSGGVTAGDALRVLRIAVGSDAQTDTCNVGS